MGTITVYEYTTVGGSGSVDSSPVFHLNTLVARTSDATTSTTAETIALNAETRYIRIEAEELHRVSMTTNTTGNGGAYEEIQAASEMPDGKQYAVNGGDTLYYRLDA